MNNKEKPVFGLNDAEDINQMKQHQLEKRPKQTDLTEMERMETEEELGHVRIKLAYIRSLRNDECSSCY